MKSEMNAERRAALRDALVSAGRVERASSARRAKVLALGAGVVVGAAISTTSTAAAATAASTSIPAGAMAAGASVAGWKMVVVAAGILAASGVAAVAVAVVERAPVTPPRVEQPRMVPPPSPTGTTTSIAKSQSAPVEIPTMSVGDLPAAKTEPAEHVARATPSAASTTQVETSSLAEELRSAEAIRAAAREGRTGEAMRLLDEHGRRFPNGALAEEALVLRIETLAKAGRAAEAKPLAERFISERPKSPYAPRVRVTLSRLD